MSSQDEDLATWLARQFQYAATAIERSISPVGIVKHRPGFGQIIRPRKGSVVASPVLADWDPEPDYFFHWYRDSALVMDALRVLVNDGSAGPAAVEHFRDFVQFSVALQKLDGRALAVGAWRDHCAPQFIRYLRSEQELALVHGDAVLADTRVNADGTLDPSTWTRPQHDGVPLRALTVLRWMRDVPFGADLDADLAQLVRADLEFTARHACEPCFDIWEEERGLHYYTLRISAAALDFGAEWLDATGDHDGAHRYRTQGQVVRRALDDFWLPEAQCFRSRILSSGSRSTKELDISVVLAAIHAADDGVAHTVRDARMQATLARLEQLFEIAYPINRRRSARAAPAMGRYAGDVYFSGGAYYFSTLGAAEFCFRAAAQVQEADAWIGRGDAFLETVREFTPPGGEMSEQFDQTTGAQSSARHLAWSYAAFITCIAARRQVVSGG